MLEQYLININKGAWNSAPCKCLLFEFKGNIYIRQFSGRAPLPEEIVAVLSGAPELVNLRNDAEEKAEPMLIQKHTGSSGCVDYLVKNIISNKETQLHVSMFGKLNEGLSIPIWALTTLITIMKEDYGYSTVVEYTVEETGVLSYNSYFPWRPFTGIDEKEVEEIEVEI